MADYKEDQTFKGIDFNQEKFATANYDNCVFENCLLIQQDLSNILFTDCRFDACDLSNARLSKTALQNIRFTNCKLQGLHFEDCSPFLFAVDFHHCILNFSSFFTCKLKKTNFVECQLRETDFTEADLTEAVFSQCDLLLARFERSNLQKADFRTAYNYIINPAINNMKKSLFSLQGAPGLLRNFGIELE